MPKTKTKTKRVAARQSERIRQKYHSNTEAVARSRPIRPPARQASPGGFAGFVQEFPVLTGIITIALVVGIISFMANRQIGPFAPKVVADTCSWAKNPAGFKIPSPIVRTFKESPQLCITDKTPGNYTAQIVTAKGTISLVLAQQQAQFTVNNFVFLATHGVYNNTLFHRVETGILQGGDPTTANSATKPEDYGKGTTGYHIPDEFPSSSDAYRQGCLAMANSGSGTTSAQFFICTQDDKYLQPQYNFFGTVYGGLDIAQSLQKNDVIQKITITYDPKGLPGVAPGATPTSTPAATATPSQ